MPVYELTWTKAGSWHARSCACPGQFEGFDLYHLTAAGIGVLPHPSQAVLACTWDGLRFRESAHVLRTGDSNDGSARGR